MNMPMELLFIQPKPVEMMPTEAFGDRYAPLPAIQLRQDLSYQEAQLLGLRDGKHDWQNVAYFLHTKM